MNTHYELRRYSASGVYYGECIQRGTRREILVWLKPVLERRERDGWECTRMRNVFELTHDDRADVITYSIEVSNEASE